MRVWKGLQRFWRVMFSIFPCCPLRGQNSKDSYVVGYSSEVTHVRFLRCTTVLRDYQRCGHIRHWRLWRHPCGHHFCRECKDQLIDDGFRDIEGLGSSPCPQ
ncbi:hypothetical protein J4Q44_G00019060, partial [Coregonus suidteri]